MITCLESPAGVDILYQGIMHGGSSLDKAEAAGPRQWCVHSTPRDMQGISPAGSVASHADGFRDLRIAVVCGVHLSIAHASTCILACFLPASICILQTARGETRPLSKGGFL